MSNKIQATNYCKMGLESAAMISITGSYQNGLTFEICEVESATRVKQNSGSGILHSSDGCRFCKAAQPWKSCTERESGCDTSGNRKSGYARARHGIGVSRCVCHG